MSQRTSRPFHFLGLTALLVSSGVLSAWALVASDSCVRTGWRYFSVLRHVAGALGLYAAVGALLGVLASALIALEWYGVGRHAARRDPALVWPRTLFYALVGAAASVSTALWTFSGEHVAKTRLASFGPFLFVLLAGAASGFGSWLLFVALGARARGERAKLGAISAVFGLGGAATAWVDLTFFVALYSRIHTILELVAALLFGAAFALLLLSCCDRRYWWKKATNGFAAAMLTWLLLLVSVPALRAFLDGALAQVWQEEAYVGRVLRRVQIAEAFFKDPWHWRGLALARIDRLRERYPLHGLELAPAWQEPLREAPEFRARIDALRGARRRYNIIVYYVDTLRSDVADDGATMPNLQAFAARAIDFTHAYATGSDTLRSLPALTGGNYDVLKTPENDILKVARRAGYRSTLVIAKSAHRFIGTLRPGFRFDRTFEVADYPAEQDVWGYGAGEPTASAIVDRGIELINAHGKAREPFLLWLFNFDQHNWRELDASYVDRAADRYSIRSDPSRPAWRYRAVAAAIDREFGRLQRELERRDLLKDTIVLFVSDHGEALGQSGFQAHSVFLWEHLVRVPLLLALPGIASQRVAAQVSLVDVAPTLARYMEAEPSTSDYQGVDLLGYLLPDHPPRRLPLLLMGASKDVLVRVGVIDPERPTKLVLSLEAALPELYDVSAADPDTQNLARQRPQLTLELLRRLTQSPVFPRAADDFDLRDTKEQKALSLPERG